MRCICISFFIIVTLSISRVLSLDGHLSSPAVADGLRVSPCHLRIYAEQAIRIRCCFGQGLQQTYVTIGVGELLPRLSILTLSGGFFLLHFPGSRLRLTLSATLPCEARTFLTVIPFGTIPRDRLTKLQVRLYHNIILLSSKTTVYYDITFYISFFMYFIFDITIATIGVIIISGII